MRRFIVEHIAPEDETVSIGGQEARHIVRVLRMGAGDGCVIMDMSGARYRAVVESTAGKTVRVRLRAPLPPPAASPLHLTLCQAVLKSPAMDMVIQKVSELGVDRLIPFSCQRSVINPDASSIPNKMRHWREIARNAAAQSDRPVPLIIEPLLPFARVVKEENTGDPLKVVLWEEEVTLDLKGVLRSRGAVPRFTGMVGPEGGFPPEEIELAREAGFHVVTVGKRILRAETAAVTLAALVQYELGDLGIASS